MYRRTKKLERKKKWYTFFEYKSKGRNRVDPHLNHGRKPSTNYTVAVKAASPWLTQNTRLPDNLSGVSFSSPGPRLMPKHCVTVQIDVFLMIDVTANQIVVPLA